MRYTVVRIDEDMDFGCEERTADSPVMAIVTLSDGEGKERVISYPDQSLYDNDINEGDSVIWNEKEELHKAITGDWEK